MSDSHETSRLDRPVRESLDEETPMMRSVRVAGPSSLLQDPRPFESKLSFGKPPALGISRQGSSSKTSSSFAVKREWNAVAPVAALWNVKGENLEMVPTNFPLERTHREIFDDASKVASRISDVLRELSIETEFDCERAKAKCTTSDYVCFRIRLYAGDESGQPVVVEVQRRNGSSSSFMRSCRAILDRAEGMLKEAKASKLPPFLHKPISQMACLQSVTLPRMAESTTSMDTTMSMLRSSSRDTNVLGFESLCALTDASRTDSLEAVRASKSIILSDDVREEIRSFTERDMFVAEDEEEMARHRDQLRQLSLCALANATVLCSKDGCLADAVQTQRWFAEYLLPTLLDELKRADSHMNNAHQAARCVHGLVTCSDVGKKLVVENGGVVILQQAHAVGLVRHEMLATETQQCLDCIDFGSATMTSSLL